MHMHKHKHKHTGTKSNGETPSIPREQLRSPECEVSAQRGRSDCRVHVIKSKMFR